MKTRKLIILTAASVALVLPAVPAAPAEVGQVRADEANFRFSNDLRNGRARDAPGLAVDPKDPLHIAGVSIEMFKGDCDHHVTFDGGRTWTDGHLTAPEGFPTPLCQTGGGTAMMDQSIAFDSAGTIFTTFTAVRSGEGRSVLVARSDDGGRTFATGIVAIPGGAGNQGASYLLPKLVIEPRAGGDRIYLVARRSQETVVASSDDGAATWSAPVLASAAGETAIEQTQPVVDPAGNVFVGWRTLGAAGSLIVAKSTDGGKNWTRTTAAAVRGYEGNTASSFPRLAVDGRSGALYLVYGQGPAEGSSSQAATAGRTAQDHFIHPDSEVLLVRSTNAGAAWSQPVRVSEAFPDIVTTRHPNVSVAPDGRVDVIWHDRRHAYRPPTNSHGPPTGNPNGEARLGDTYYAYSTDGGVTFLPNRRLTDRTFNNDIGADYRSNTYWSYGPVAVSVGPNRILTAWMESRLGNVDTENQDIYLSYVDLAADGTPPVRSIAAPDDRTAAVNLAHVAYPAGPEGALVGTFASEQVTKVVIVNENDAALATVAGVLGRATLGPVLLSSAEGLDEQVKAEVARMAPIGAFVVGDEKALSPRVEDDLAAAGVDPDTIERISGASPAQTAARVAQSLDRRPIENTLPLMAEPAFDGAVIVNPSSASALLATTLAAARRLPVLFVERDTVPAATADALESLAIPTTLVIGGTDDISDAVAKELPAPKRLGGATLAATSEAVTAESVARRLPPNSVFVADPAHPVQAAVLGAAAGRIGGVLVLSEGGDVTAAGEIVKAAGFGAMVDRYFRLGAAVSSSTAPQAAPQGAPGAPGGQLPATGGPVELWVFGLLALGLGMVVRRVR